MLHPAQHVPSVTCILIRDDLSGYLAFHAVAWDAARDSTEASKGAERVPEGAAAQQPASSEAQWVGSTATRPATVIELWEEYQANQVQSIL